MKDAPSKRPSAQLTEGDVTAIWNRIECIRHGNVEKDSQGRIAIDYGVNKKTINRIATGETWSDVTNKLRQDQENYRKTVVKVDTLPSVPTTLADLCDEAYAAKTSWCLDYERPIHWGFYDAWNGKHSVATDGIILWEDPRLVGLAQKFAESGVNEHPLLASNAEELDTFSLFTVLTRPIGQEYRLGEEFGTGITQLISPQGKVVCVRSKFVKLATKNKCQFRQAGDTLDFVYLTKSKTERSDPVLLAAIAVMEPK